MIGFVGLKVRLYPTEVQRSLIEKTFGCCRKVANAMLAKRIEVWTAEQRTIARNKFINALPNLKKKFPWLSEVDSQALQQAIIDMDKAFVAFFDKKSHFPQFKSKHGPQAFRSTQQNRVMDDSHIKIGKTGVVRCRGMNGRYSGEKIRNVTVSRDSCGHYYASVLIEKDRVVYDHCHEFIACGVDVGIAKPLTIGWEDNDNKPKYRHIGNLFTNRLAVKEQKRLKYQKQLSRKKVGSNGFKRAKVKLAKAFASERNLRDDWRKKTALFLCRKFTQINFEKLNLRRMLSTKTVEAERMKQHKTKLNRDLSRLGFADLIAFCEQKAVQFGVTIQLVDPRNTSRQCSCCGHTEKANRISQSRFKCVSCGFEANADANASWNILRRPAFG